MAICRIRLIFFNVLENLRVYQVIVRDVESGCSECCHAVLHIMT